MADRMDRDHRRFKKIVRGKVRDNLKDLMKRGKMKGKHGDETVNIPIPQIDLPEFTHGSGEGGGVGQGEGEPGDMIEGDEEGEGEPGEAGEGEGDHELDHEMSIDELAEIMGEELELPDIEPKGDEEIKTVDRDYHGIKDTGPEALRDDKRSFKEALKRQVASGEYDPEDPIVIPRRDDRMYRTFEEIEEPESNAVLIYMMDVSGSMGGDQKEIVRTLSFWIDTWISHQYDGAESIYITHDASAREVDRETFFHTRESGGTMISSAYKLCRQIIKEDFPPSRWNIYPFHFSDGDNWSSDDTATSMEYLEEIIQASNQFCYGQTESPYGSGQFIEPIQEVFGDNEAVTTARIQDRDEIYDAIQTFLGKGR